MNGDELIRKLRALANDRKVDFSTKPGKGDHVKVYLDGKMAPLPGRKEEIKTGTLSGILRMLTLTRDDLK